MGFYVGEIDNRWGPRSEDAYQAFLKAANADPDKAAIAQEGIDLILEFEGLDQPGRWPGASSGITLGHGYDLGYTTEATFVEDWARHLDPRHLERLKAAIGVKGSAASRLASAFEEIRITPYAADEVFVRATLPTFIKRTRAAFPGIDSFPVLVLAALVSLVFNRGEAMDGERRKEMRAIRDMVANPVPDKSEAIRFIAAKIRSMKRLWIGQGVDGLIRRREAEAVLVENALGHIA